MLRRAITSCTRAVVSATRAGAFVSLAAAVMLLALGCQGGGGAVSVRWRIVDLSTGAAFDPGDIKVANGSCCYYRSPGNGVCQSDNSWIIESVSILLGDATTGAPVPDNLPSFACGLREKTTPFVLPAGTFAISLAAQNEIGDGMNVPAPVALPPPSVRTIINGDVVNLDVIEIGVNPLPLPP